MNKEIKKLIWKFWIINFLLIIGTFFISRLFLTESSTISKYWLIEIFNLMGDFMYMIFTLIYAALMSICSLTIFLNLNRKIRKTYFFSLLTFLAIPSICVLYFVLDSFIDTYDYKTFSEYITFLKTSILNFLAFPIIYLIGVSLVFILFRIALKKQYLNEENILKTTTISEIEI